MRRGIPSGVGGSGSAAASTILGVGLSLVTITSLCLGIYGITLGRNNNQILNSLAPQPGTPVGSCASAEARRVNAYTVRVKAAFDESQRPVPCHLNNGDEAQYPLDRRAQFTKTMLHNATTGLVIGSYYDSLLAAVESKNFTGVLRAPGATEKLTNPLAGLAYDLIGSDAQSLAVPPPPKFNSSAQAIEYVENAWMALLRDVPFDQYATNPNAIAAAAELSALTGTTVNASTLFRGNLPGCSTGPYLSQFFYLPCKYGPFDVSFQFRPLTAGLDFMTNMTTWLNVQNGFSPLESETYQVTPRYMINGRDIALFCWKDMLFQSYHQAAMILLAMDAPYNPTNPYLTSLNQKGFATFGGPHVSTLVTEVADRALHAAWYQKWFVSRRLRPEVFGARVDRHKKNITLFDIHPYALNSTAGTTLNSLYGGYFIPQAYPEGSPTHPSYAAGHATVAGACVTILKALFDGSYVIPYPQMPNAGGSALVNYTLSPLTVENELNKAAANVGLGRNIAGVHWRSDFDASVRLGEQVAIATLRDYKATFAEGLQTWRFKGFDGSIITI